VSRRTLALPIAALAVLALAWTQPRLADLQRRQPALDAPALLPGADAVRVLALGQEALVADLLMARALSYYGAHYRHQADLDFTALLGLFRLALELDPDNIDACLLAANLVVETRPRDAIALLEDGRLRNPESWKLPEMIGFTYYFALHDAARAARYYELAAHLPGHPPYVPSLASKFYQESGSVEHALRVLTNFYATTRNPRLKRNFGQMIEKLRAAPRNAR
jgi:hypothetical protein